MPLGPGTRLGPYEIQSALGAGGMGRIWRAHHTLLKRDDALKVIPPPQLIVVQHCDEMLKRLVPTN
jgi:serine/threonine protein kinase